MAEHPIGSDVDYAAPQAASEPTTEDVTMSENPKRADFVSLTLQALNDKDPNAQTLATLALAQQTRAANLLNYFTQDTSGMTVDEHNLMRSYLRLDALTELPPTRKSVALSHAQQAVVANILTYLKSEGLNAEDARFIEDALGLPKPPAAA